MEKELKGLVTITVTPFKEDGSVDEKSIRGLTESYIRQGVNGMTVLGNMGEVQKLTEQERMLVIENTVAQSNGRVPVLVGCTANSTDVAVHFCRQAEKAGAFGVMIAPPYNIKNEALLLKHYSLIAERTALPIVLQDEPTSTNVLLSPDFIAKLVESIDSIEYVKLEEAPTTIKITRVLEKTNKAKIFGGLFGMYFYEEMVRGASGVMTGFAFPEILVKMYDLFIAGKRDEARQHFYKYLPLIRFEGQLGMGGVAIRKEIYRMRDAIATSHVRFPAAPIDTKTLEELKDMIAFLGLKL